MRQLKIKNVIRLMKRGCPLLALNRLTVQLRTGTGGNFKCCKIRDVFKSALIPGSGDRRTPKGKLNFGPAVKAQTRITNAPLFTPEPGETILLLRVRWCSARLLGLRTFSLRRSGLVGTGGWLSSPRCLSS